MSRFKFRTQTIAKIFSTTDGDITIEHARQCLAAYYDRELKGCCAQQVEAHLETCITCLNELESLRVISSLLLEYLEAMNTTPAGTFKAQVDLCLPRTSSKKGCTTFSK